MLDTLEESLGVDGIGSTALLIWGTFGYILLEKSGKGNNIRKYAVYAGWIFYILMVIFGLMDNLELREKEDDFFYRMDNPPTVDTERSMYLNITDFCEWAMVFSFYTGALTYRKELDGIPI